MAAHNFRRPKLSTTELDEADLENLLLQSMKPTLIDDPGRQSTQLKDSERAGNDDSKYATTFGFSHGVEKVQSGVIVRRGIVHQKQQ